MKKTNAYLFAVLLTIPAGCNLLENDLTADKPRRDCERSGNGADSLNIIESPADSLITDWVADTTVFVSAVRCGPGYDWQRDTAYGCAGARLLLYKNGEEILDIPAGDGTCVSAAPDLHHILDGHLYTEYCDYSRTVIGRDGEELFSFTGREILKGLFVRDSVLYTLSVGLSSGKLIFRKNGVEVFSKAGAAAFGGFDKPSYGQGGALYEDSGAICFAYKVKNACYIVRDGLATEVSAYGALDVKSVSGEDVVVKSMALGYRWKDAEIWRIGSSHMVAGESAETGETGVFRAVHGTTRQPVVFRMERALLYCSASGVKAVDLDDMEKSSFCFSPGCAAILGENLAVLGTPRNGGTPFLKVGEKRTLFEGLEGYLTGITASISYPSLPLLPRP